MLIVRLVELLIVIVPVIGVIYGGYKAVSKVRERSDDAPTVEAPEPERIQQVGPVAGDRADGAGSTTGRTPVGSTTKSTSASCSTIR